MDEQTSGNTLRDAHALRRIRDEFWHRREIRSCADDAANHTSQLSAGNATRHSTHYAAGAGEWRRSLVFLNHLDLLRNFGRRAQLAVVQHVCLNLVDHPLNLLGGWRWRRWRRWRRDEEGQQLGFRQVLGKYQRHD